MSSTLTFKAAASALFISSALLFSGMNAQAQSSLSQLGEMNLQYQQSKTKNVPNYAKPTGKYLGSGTGVMAGHVKAKVRWDLYEDQSRDDLHKAQFVGFLETADGDKIPFESIGYFKPRKGGKFWDLTSSVHFDCDNPKYPELVGQRIFWEGSVKTDEWSHQYRLYTVSN